VAKFNRSMQVEGKLVVDEKSFAAGIRRAVRDTDKLNRAAKQTGKNNGFRNIGRAALGAAAGIGAVTIAADQLRRSINDTVDLAKATRQLQRATGLASEEASALAGVLKVRGVNTDKLGRSFTTLARNVEAAKTGVAGAAEAFAKLGVSQQAIQTGNVNRILVEAADGFQKLGDGTSKAAVAQQLFGRNSRDLLPLLEGGSKTLREQLALAPQLSDAQVKQSLATVAAQRQIQLAMLNVRTTIGTALMPTIAQGAEKLGKFITEMKTGKGEGGKFAEQVRKIWQSVKPAVEQLAEFAKAAFKFAANNPGLVKVAASLAAIGLAIKGIKFVSAISGLSTFLTTARGLGGPLKKLFSRFGTRAGGAFAAEAAGSMAGSSGMAGALAPSGKLGKLGKKDGKFHKFGGRLGRVAAGGFIIGFVAFFGEEIVGAIKKKMEEIGLPDFLVDHFGGFFSPRDAQAPTINPNSKAYKDWERRQAPRRRNNPSARGSSSARGASAMRPSLNPRRGSIYDLRGMDPLTGGIPVEALLQRAEGKAASAQYRVDRYQAKIGDSRSKAETKRLKELTEAARVAQREVNKLQKQLARRDALLEIRQQFQDFKQGFIDAYSSGLQAIADARLTAANTLAQKVLDTQLKNLDEEEGQSEEARRLRELRTQQELDAKAREDEDYAKQKLALETDLERAIRNGNVRGQADLNAQIEALDEQRREVLRNREIGDLSESLARQRRAAQDDYEARVGAAQEYYDRQLELNKAAVDEYKKVIDKQFGDLQEALEAGKISYAEYYQRVSDLGGWLTGMLQGDLNNRAEAELRALRDSEGAYTTYVTNVNAVLDGIRQSIPVPEIPPIPEINVDAVLKIQRIDGLPSGVTIGGTQGGGTGGGGPSGPNRFSLGEAFEWLKDNDPKRGAWRPVATRLAEAWGWSKDEVIKYFAGKGVADWAKKNKVYLQKRVSGGPLNLSRGAMTLVGETGPELIMPGVNGPEVMSATRTARAGGGVTLNVYPQTTADDPVALARALGWQLANR
jgi:hypothetical protein